MLALNIPHCIAAGFFSLFLLFFCFVFIFIFIALASHSFKYKDPFVITLFFIWCGTAGMIFDSINIPKFKTDFYNYIEYPSKSEIKKVNTNIGEISLINY